MSPDITGAEVHGIAVHAADLVVTAAKNPADPSPDALVAFISDHLHTPTHTRYGAIAIASVAAVALDPDSVHACTCGKHTIGVAFFTPTADGGTTRNDADNVEEPHRTIGRLLAATVAGDDTTAEALMVAVPDTSMPELLATLYGLAVTLVRTHLEEPPA